MSRKIMTVTGAIEPEELGFCLTHEHLTIDGSGLCPVPSDTEAVELFNSPVRAELVGVLRRNPVAVLSNAKLDDDEVLADELADYQRQGGRSIVDVTPVCIGRDVVRLQNLSKATGLYIVAGSGYYIAALQGAWVRDASVEEIAERLRVEVTEGVDDTGVRPGVIGELGVSMPMAPTEEKVLRAAARVQKVTGIAISLHVFAHVAAQALDVLEREGADLTRVVVGHCDGFLDGEGALTVHRDLAKRGCYLAYDTFGLETRMPPGLFAPIPVWAPGDGVRIKAVLSLLESGLASQLLMSQDTSQKSQLLKYGGFGYGYLLRTIIPDLLSLGASQSDIDQIFIANPRRLLAF